MNKRTLVLSFAASWLFCSPLEAQEAKVPDAIKKAEAVLIQKPDDPDANTTVGKYLLEKGDLEMALPFLAKGKDDVFRKLLEHEAKELKSGPELIGMGDEWSALLKRYPKGRTALLDRAGMFWAKGWPLLDEFWRKTSRENLSRIYVGQAGAGAAKPLSPGGWNAEKVALSGERVHSGAFAARLPMPKGNEGNFHQPLKLELPIPAGTKSLEVSAWVLADGTDNVNDDMKPSVSGAGGKLLSATGTPIPMDLPVWTRVSQTVSCEGALKLSLVFEFQSRKGCVFIDDVDIRVDGKSIFTNGGFEK